MIRRSRLLMRLASCFAVVAVVQAMAAQPVLACERHDAVPAHTSHTAPQSAHGSDCADGQAPAPAQHDGDCLANCLTMSGCSAPCFMAEIAGAVSATHDADPAVALLQPHPTRFVTPDRPPPRV
jgi:hypothetical protein